MLRLPQRAFKSGLVRTEAGDGVFAFTVAAVDAVKPRQAFPVLLKHRVRRGAQMLVQHIRVRQRVGQVPQRTFNRLHKPARGGVAVQPGFGQQVFN